MKQFKLETEYKVYDDVNELDGFEKELVLKSREATKLSYSPYSRFKVGAAVGLEGGEIVCGANHENASYGMTVCAERTTLQGISNAGKSKSVRYIAVTGRAEVVPEDAVLNDILTPCGACRQVIREFEDLNKVKFVLLCSAWNGKVYRFEGIESLLPFGFGPKDLEV